MPQWPTTYDPRELRQLSESAAPATIDWLSSHNLSHLAEALERFYLPLALTVHHWRSKRKTPLVFGIAGGQGSGKSTLAALLAQILKQGFGYQVARLSLDDLYYPHAYRQELGDNIHPLLATRGVPGTHDVQLGIDLIHQLSHLGAGQQMRLPRFDKAHDERLPVDKWPTVNGPLDIILFEGWCLGARPQPEYALKIAVNNLEECEDAELIWRSFVNRHLASDYAELFTLLDRLLFLQAPSWESVFIWRQQQEQQLVAATPDIEGTRIMDEPQLRRFVSHYERITRLMLATTPHSADICVELGVGHEITSINFGNELAS
ncbi:MAG: hypothetical protein C0624_09050 [Desulfuromonas sp.]|nr:MAG: hypothetical protein C0624_09050 [Desulfuromonas sp.]